MLKTLNVLRACLAITWILIAGSFFMYHRLLPSFPSAILNLLYTNPLYTYSQMLYGVSIAILGVASIGLWFGKQQARILFLAGTGVMLFSLIVLGSKSIYVDVNILDDGFRCMLGVICGIIFSKSFNNNTRFNLSTVKSLRFVCVALIIAWFCLFTFGIPFALDQKFKIVTEYMDSLTIFLTPVALVSTLAFNIIAVILLSFRLRFAKYIYSLTLLMLLVTSPVMLGAESTVLIIFNNICVILLGVLLAIIYCPNLAKELYPRSLAKNTIIKPKFRLPMSDTVAEAWKKVRGAKATIWIAYAIYIVIFIGLIIIRLVNHAIFPDKIILGAAIKTITFFIGNILGCGLIYIGIQRAKEAFISSEMIFRSFELGIFIRLLATKLLIIIMMMPLAIAMIFSTIALKHTSLAPHINIEKLIEVSLIILIVSCFFYLIVRTALAGAYVVDLKMNPVEAIKKSFQATAGNFFRLIGIYFLMWSIVLASIIPLGIGLVWSIPLCIILQGLVYKKLSDNVNN